MLTTAGYASKKWRHTRHVKMLKFSGDASTDIVFYPHRNIRSGETFPVTLTSQIDVITNLLRVW